MDDELLISEVKQHPCLYNTRCLHFKVALKKENAWKTVSTALGVTGKSEIACISLVASICYAIMQWMLPKSDGKH